MPRHWSASDRRGMALNLNEKMQIIDTNLARLDTMAVSLVEMREAFLLEKVRALTSEITNEYPEDVCEQMIRDEHFPEEFRSMTGRDASISREAGIQEGVLASEQIANVLKSSGHDEQIRLCQCLAHVNDALYEAAAVRRNTWKKVAQEEKNTRFGKAWIQRLNDLIREEDHFEDETVPDLDVHAARPTGESIAYLRNTYTDRAYTRFQSILQHTTAVYYSDFQGVCESLYYDRESACILPMENSVDGKLLRFYSLLNKYDLRIAYTCSVTTEDTDVTTRYALLRKNITVPNPDEFDACEGLYMECRAVLNEEHPLSDLLAAAAWYHLTLTRVDTIPTDYDDGERTYDLILRMEEDGDLAAMLTYLYLMVPQFTVFGIYLAV